MTTELETACKNNEITMTAHLVGPAPAKQWGAGSTQWKCDIHYEDRSMSIEFHQGSAHKNPPRVADVLYCVLSDALGADQDFEDWCADLGCDTDSRKAYATWQACAESGRQIVDLLGEDLTLSLQSKEH